MRLDFSLNTRKKRHPQKNKERTQTVVRQLLLRVAVGAITYMSKNEERLNEKGRGFNESKNTTTKQNKRNTRERRHDIICKPSARRIQVRATCGCLVDYGERTSTSPPACFGPSSPWPLPVIIRHHSSL